MSETVNMNYGWKYSADFKEEYLSATFDDSSSMHWTAQCVNLISQGAFLWGTAILHRAGLAQRELFAAKKAAV